jgi:hypothetical protein
MMKSEEGDYFVIRSSGFFRHLAFVIRDSSAATNAVAPAA